jgi:hypothetical protein
LDNDPGLAVALLVITWIVQGIINAGKTAQILQLQKEVANLRKRADSAVTPSSE